MTPEDGLLARVAALDADPVMARELAAYQRRRAARMTCPLCDPSQLRRQADEPYPVITRVCGMDGSGYGQAFPLISR
jgi:hypothetical protein